MSRCVFSSDLSVGVSDDSSEGCENAATTESVLEDQFKIAPACLKSNYCYVAKEAKGAAGAHFGVAR